MQRRIGFTLIELLIVVIIIAIIAAIAIPKFVFAKQQSQESAARMQLRLTRDALQRFNADTGMWPILPDDLAGGSAPSQAYNGGGQAKPLDSTTYKGPYISAPCVPNDLALWVQYVWVGGGTKAKFWCPQSGTALDGTSYSSW